MQIISDKKISVHFSYRNNNINSGWLMYAFVKKGLFLLRNTSKWNICRTPECCGTLKSDCHAKVRWSATNYDGWTLATAFDMPKAKVVCCKDLPKLSLLNFTTHLYLNYPCLVVDFEDGNDFSNDVTMMWCNIHIQTASCRLWCGWQSDFSADHHTLESYI